MTEKVNGFQLDITVVEGVPRVRVLMSSGETVLETDRLSMSGLRNMAAVMTRAADIVFEELDRYWQKAHDDNRRKQMERADEDL